MVVAFFGVVNAQDSTTCTILDASMYYYFGFFFLLIMIIFYPDAQPDGAGFPLGNYGLCMGTQYKGMMDLYFIVDITYQN